MSPHGCGSFKLRPVILRGQDRNDFKVNQIVPTACPDVEPFCAGCLHDLEATCILRVDPTCVVDDIVGHHSAIADEALANRQGVAILEMFDDHEEHTRLY